MIWGENVGLKLKSSGGQRLIVLVCREGPTSVGRTIVAMIVTEDWTVGSCAGDPSLGARVTGTKTCDGGLSMRDLKGVAENETHLHSEELELAEVSP